MPIVNGQYQAPTWVNGQRPPINAEELQAICDTLAATLPADQILSAATIAMWGLQSGATPDEVFQTIYEKYSEFLQPIITLDNFYTFYGVTTSSKTPASLSSVKYQLAATTVGNYALFAGGAISGSSTYYSSVDYYTNTLLHSTTTSLSSARCNLAATTIGNYALFAGGYASSGNFTYYDTVDTYNSSLIKGTATNLSNGKTALAATAVGNYALFAGGAASSAAYYSNVDSYTSNLIHGTPTSLSSARCNLAATTIGNYALFAGGYSSPGSSNIVDAYNQNLVRTNPESLSNNVSSNSATYTTNYAVFSEDNNQMDAYNSNLIKTLGPTPNASLSGSSATSIIGSAVFGGSSNANRVFVCNDSLVLSSQYSLQTQRISMGATTIGNYVLFAGGSGSSNAYNVVDAFLGGYVSNFTIPAMSQYKINGYANQETFTPSPIDVQIIGTTGGVTGYIKMGGFTLSGLN